MNPTWVGLGLAVFMAGVGLGFVLGLEQLGARVAASVQSAQRAAAMSACAGCGVAMTRVYGGAAASYPRAMTAAMMYAML